MLTVFACPKPFTDPHIAIIQRNAITSWTLLKPTCEIILFGDDEGTAEAAAEFGARHIPDIARNEYGTPLVSDLFEKAQRLATHDSLCYVNADMILMSDLMRAAKVVVRHQRSFLMVGQRWDICIKAPLDFKLGWEEKLQADVARRARLHRYTGMDYFVFPRGLFANIPPFAIGRTTWDNWLLYGARSQGAHLIDVTNAVMAVHQNHDWSHIPEGRSWAWEGPEAIQNRKLAGYFARFLSAKDSTHLLLGQDYHRNILGTMYTSALKDIFLYIWSNKIWIPFINLSRPVRYLLGLTRSKTN